MKVDLPENNERLVKWDNDKSKHEQSDDAMNYFFKATLKNDYKISKSTVNGKKRTSKRIYIDNDNDIEITEHYKYDSITDTLDSIDIKMKKI